jgi:hypothetical protein
MSSSAGPALRTTTALALASGLAGIALITWHWQGRVTQTRRADWTGEPWDRVRDAYPMLSDPPALAAVSKELMEGMVRANPFSSKRRLVTPAIGMEPDGQAAGPVKPPPPVFMFKGRVKLGQRVRAIVQEIGSQKTYFLEVGQAVAGFKVLDIAENRVVLSDPISNEAIDVSLISPEGS